MVKSVMPHCYYVLLLPPSHFAAALRLCISNLLQKSERDAVRSRPNSEKQISETIEDH
jgi:hypothetical protein